MLKIDGNLMGKVLTSPIRCVKANIKRDENGELYLEYFGETKIESGEEINIGSTPVLVDRSI